MKENPVYPVSHFMADTIVALATPIGRSGIGVVRLSGARAFDISTMLADKHLEARYATLVQLVDPESREVIDEAVATFFKAPRSFTGDDVVEICCHGSPVLLRRVIDLCLSLGARMADPGEFTLRALGNGKIDLAEAEAIRDLIDAQTTSGMRQAVRQMRGEFSHELQPIKDELLDVIVILESALEFVEDDLPETQSASIKAKLEKLVAAIDKIAGTFQAGRLIREGLRVALVGKPNVGKSSLFNALLGSDRAIVTEIAGTTRDQIHERFTMRDIPISLVDTAGLRETKDTVEVIGVERSRRTMADADLVLVVLDASEDLSREDLEILDDVKELDHLIVINKVDKVSDKDVEARLNIQNRPSKTIPVSAKTGQGLEELKGAIVDPFISDDFSSNGFLVTDARHFDLLTRARSEVENSINLLDQKLSEEIVLVGLHNGLRFLGQITGETTTEDMLSRIFSTFCIGK